jgi:dihydroxyacetone kinase-like protein
VEDLPYSKGSEVAVLINGLGATPLEEQYVVFRKVNKMLQEYDIKIYRTYIGEFATSLEMAGVSVSLLKLDDELKHFLDKPADTPFFAQFLL